MSVDAQRLSYARRRLEEKFGLAMAGVTDPEIARALAAAGAPERPIAEEDAAFWVRCVDQLPIDESCLFRDPSLWAWLAETGLPPRVARALSERGQVRALSLGCAGGQEAFSLAMVLLDLFKACGMPAAAVPRYAAIRGVDASAARVAAARNGVLNAWSVERASGAKWAAGNLSPHPELPNHHRVDPAVAALTSFEQGNLLDLPPAAVAGHDLVLCRHVLIYFTEARAQQLLAGIAAGLDPGALLVVSPVEAHLLDRIDTLTRLDPVGVARCAAPTALPLPIRSAPHSPRPLPPVMPGGLDLAAAHLRAGRADQALQAARAVSYAEPENLMARLLIGQALLRLDPAHGRRILEGLASELSALDEAGRVGPELTVGQIRQAVGLLLEAR